jgi:hypothetical protein
MDNPEKLKGQSRMDNPEKLKGQSIMDNPEKLEHWVLKTRTNKAKYPPQYMLDTTIPSY